MPPPEQSSWFYETVQPHEPALRAYLLKRFPALPDHDDVIQEAYLRMLRMRDQVRDEQTLYEAAMRLTQPVMLVHGAQSDVINEDITREFQARIPHARIADVGGAGHMVAGDRNDVFLDAVLEFLDSLPAANSPQGVR